MNIVISSGHGLYVRGASSIIDEVDEARKVVPKTASYLRVCGAGVVEYHDNTSQTQSENVNRIVNYHNSQSRDLDISVHFNAASRTEDPRGVEVLYLSESGRVIADKVSAAISSSSGLRNRGAKKRTDLGFLNNTNKTAILIEVCFVDSTADVGIYQNKFDEICKVIAESITGNKVDPTPIPPGDKGYMQGTINTGETFVVGIKNTVSSNGEWVLTAVNQWVVAIKETEVLGYKPNASQYPVGKNLYEVKYYKDGYGWFTRGWVHGNFDYLYERPVGYSQMYNEYKYQLRKTAKLYDKNGEYVAELPAGRYFFTKETVAHPSDPNLIRCDRNETSLGDFSTIYGTYGWVETNAEDGVGKGDFGIRFIE